MSSLSLPLTQLVHENLSVVMNFCFSRASLTELVATRFSGEWPYLQKTLFGLAEQRAGRAVLELAMFVRLLDDREGISAPLRETGDLVLGRLFLKGDREQPLTMREAANKIIHASAATWDLSNPAEPRLVCVSQNDDKWQWRRAEIDIVALAACCGSLIH